MGEAVNRARPLQTITLAVQPDKGGLIALHMHHPKGLSTVLHLSCDETDALIDVLAEARLIAQPNDPKPRIAVTLLRNEA